MSGSVGVPVELAGEDAAWMWLNGHVECDPADRDYSADEMVDAFMAGQSAALRARSSAPEAREGEAWPERWSGPCTVGNMISNLRTLPPEMPLYSAYHIPMDDQPSLLKVKRPTLSRERVDGTNIKTGNESIPYSAVIWSQPRDPEEAHPAAPSADKLRTALSEIRDGMVASRDCISVDDWIELADEALSTPDALKGDAKWA